MASAGEPHVMPISQATAAVRGAVRGAPVRIGRAANDNHRTHATWRRFVAASMAALFAASLILVGMICIAAAAELPSAVIASN